MKTTLVIPKKCKVGFNTRTDTYTGRLGYIIYHDGKEWRKEKSWEGWREKHLADEKAQQNLIDTYNKNYHEKYPQAYAKAETFNDVPSYWRQGFSTDPLIVPVEFDNEPTEGFVLNKKAGGYSTGWNHRQTYCRVYDPRGFEFEINIPNLLYILENTNSIKGKGLEGKFVYGWDGKDLVLIPASSPDFKDIVEYNDMLKLSIKKSELVPGDVYVDSKNDEFTYLGEFMYYDYMGSEKGKKLWFSSTYNKTTTFTTKTISSLKKKIGTNENFASIMDILAKDRHYTGQNKAWVKADKSDFDKLIPLSTSNYYFRIFNDLKIRLRGSNKKMNARYNRTSITYGVEIKSNSETFKSFEKLEEKYELWVLKTIS